MSDSIQAEVSVKFNADFKQLEDKLRTIPIDIIDSGMKSALDKAMAPVLQAARAFVPAKTGTLRSSLAQKSKVYKETGIGIGLVGPAKDTAVEIDGKIRNPRKYAHLVEFSHNLNIGLTKAGKRRVIKIGDRFVTVKQYQGESQAVGFLQHAADSQGQNAIDIYCDSISKFIEKKWAEFQK